MIFGIDTYFSRLAIIADDGKMIVDCEFCNINKRGENKLYRCHRYVGYDCRSNIGRLPINKAKKQEKYHNMHAKWNF
ncbi:MAG TPA: hypothetical protein DCG33_07000 [Prevotellaceae bacterium]|nr:hypothetical protein [Prevotellaceae bacterium]